MNQITLISLIVCLSIIAYQDFKERKVSVLLFVLATVFGCSLFYINTYLHFLFINIGLNMLVVAIIIFVLYGYARFKMKKKLTETIGIGDLFFFFLLAFSFSTITFLVLFSTSLFFSLFLYLILKPDLKDKTVPLAGLQALFLGIVLAINELFTIINLYAI